jgi:hypothetical protein
MSFSQATEVAVNPAKKQIEFKSDLKCFVYYDKAEKKVINIKNPFIFTVLDERSTITGWDDTNQCGIYSNDVKDLKKEDFFVKSFKGGKLVSGKYAEIKDQLKSAGAKYTKVVYALYEGEIIKVKLAGTALSAWIEKDFNVNKNTVKFEKCKEGKKGKVSYNIPVLTPILLTDVQITEATNADKELQLYFSDKEKLQNSFKDIEKMEKTTTYSDEKTKVSFSTSNPVIDKILDDQEINIEDLPF